MGIRTNAPTRRRTAALVATTTSLVLVAPFAAHASVSLTSDQTARVNGTVYAVAQVGDKTIVAGNFTQVGSQPRLNVAAIDASGKVDPDFKPDVDGVVRSLAASTDGSTVYIGGTFGTAGGAARNNLAAVDADTGAALADWSADTTGSDPVVLGLAVSGSKLYAAGRFNGIDGTTRQRLVALDLAGNVVRDFRPAPNYHVRVVAPSADGSRLFAGGTFTKIGGAERPAVAELDPVTGAARPFSVPSVGSTLTAMGISPSGDRLYFGVANNSVFAHDTATAERTWLMKNGGDTQAIAASSTEVYIGGHFGQSLSVNGVGTKLKRQWILSADPRTGAVTGWDQQLAGGAAELGVWAITTTPTALLVGGAFDTAAGEIRRRFARFQGTP